MEEWKLRYVVLHGTALRLYSPSSANNRTIMEGSTEQPDSRDAGQVRINPGPVLYGVNLDPSTPSYPKPLQSKLMWSHIRNTVSSHLHGIVTARSRNQAEEDGKDQYSVLSGVACRTRHEGLQGLGHPLAYARIKVTLDQAFTLQYAQMGLADDIDGRSNVLRMRAQGEQFLLDTQNDEQCEMWSNVRDPLRSSIFRRLRLFIRHFRRPLAFLWISIFVGSPTIVYQYSGKIKV
jgi:hypothetical protein